MSKRNSIPWLGKYLKQEYNLIYQRAPEELARLLEKYQASIGIGKKVTFSAEAFETFDKASPRDFNVFKETKEQTKEQKENKEPVNEGVIYTKLKTDIPHHTKVVKDEIGKALEKQQDYITAKKDYEDSVVNFRKLANKVPNPYRVQDLIQAMHDIKEDAIKAIKKQQTSEKNKLKASLGTLVSNGSLGHALVLTDMTAVEAAKETMIKNLDTSHAKQLADFETSTTKSMNELHKSAATQSSELVFIANLFRNGNEEMRKQIITISRQKQEEARNAADEALRAQGITPPPRSSLTVSVNVDVNEDSAILTGITLADLSTIKTMTGKSIVHDKEKGTFTLDLNTTLWDWQYHYNKQYIKSDLMDIALAVRASGYDGIVMNADFRDDPELAMERGRQAYEAAIDSGFPADKIKIKVNGKEIKIDDELFKEHRARFNITQSISEKTVKQMKDLIKPPAHVLEEKVAAIRAEMRELRNSATSISSTPTPVADAKDDATVSISSTSP